MRYSYRMAYDELLRRIEIRLKALGLSERKACLRSALSADAIRNIRRGRAPRAKTLNALAQVLEVPPSYLLEALEDSATTPGEAAPPQGQRFRVVRNAIAADLSPADDGPPKGYVAVPTLEIRLGMGGGGYAEEDLMGPPALFPERLIVRELRGKPLDFLAMEVEGQSMEPVLMSGDQVLIDRRKVNPSQPGVFSLWDGYGLVVKWVERVHDSDPPKLRVMSENKRFSEYEVLAEEARIIGRVVWFARRM